jgi:hypothetical protein
VAGPSVQVAGSDETQDNFFYYYLSFKPKVTNVNCRVACDAVCESFCEGLGHSFCLVSPEEIFFDTKLISSGVILNNEKETDIFNVLLCLCNTKSSKKIVVKQAVHFLFWHALTFPSDISTYLITSL